MGFFKESLTEKILGTNLKMARILLKSWRILKEIPKRIHQILKESQRKSLKNPKRIPKFPSNHKESQRNPKNRIKFLTNSQISIKSQKNPYISIRSLKNPKESQKNPWPMGNCWSPAPLTNAVNPQISKNPSKILQRIPKTVRILKIIDESARIFQRILKNPEKSWKILWNV